jgi:hypothetical protein
VRKPDSKDFLRAEGETVEKTSFWVRRIQDEDVVLIKEPSEKAKKQGDK